MKKASIRLVAELLLTPLVKRLAQQQRKVCQASDTHDLVARLELWISTAAPDSLLNDPDFDALELIYYCCDKWRRYSPDNLAAILGLAGSAPSEPGPLQAPLYLPYIDVPSDSVYRQVQTAVATKGFSKVEGTPYPTAKLATAEAEGQAQLKPLILDTITTVKPDDEEAFVKLMWQQHDELSDLDCDVWDYCIWKWLQRAKDLEDWVTVTVEELLTMRGIVKKSNGDGQRGGYKKTQKLAVLKSVTHLQNVWLNLFDFRVYRSRCIRPGRSASESIQDRAIRIRESQTAFEFEDSPRSSFAFRPGIIFFSFSLRCR